MKKLLLVILAFLFSGCAAKRESVAKFSAPSVVKAMNGVSSARIKAEKLEAKVPDSLKAEFSDLSSELTAAQSALGSYASDVARQTDALNAAIDEKNDAVADAQNAWAKHRKALKELWFWRLLALSMAGAVLAWVAIKTGWKIAV
jgi:uncharacterized lipoprotein YmbA